MIRHPNRQAVLIGGFGERAVGGVTNQPGPLQATIDRNAGIIQRIGQAGGQGYIAEAVADIVAGQARGRRFSGVDAEIAIHIFFAGPGDASGHLAGEVGHQPVFVGSVKAGGAVAAVIGEGLPDGGADREVAEAVLSHQTGIDGALHGFRPGEFGKVASIAATVAHHAHAEQGMGGHVGGGVAAVLSERRGGG